MDFPSIMLNVIKASPFLAAACLVLMAARAVTKGELKIGGGRCRVETVFKTSNSTRFWVQIGAYYGVAIVFVMFGLLYYNLLPHWFRQLLIQSFGHH